MRKAARLKEAKVRVIGWARSMLVWVKGGLENWMFERGRKPSCAFGA
jgi:hypothetical protein